jgi:hypothetical protein
MAGMPATRFVRDIAIHVTRPPFPPVEVFQKLPPVETRTAIADDLWIGPLDRDTYEKALDACEAPGYQLGKPNRQYGQRYTLVREQHVEDHDSWNWDSDEMLQTAIVFSRLIHPTSIGLAHTARMIYEADEQTIREIVPGPITGTGAYAFVGVIDGYRDWLTDTDVEQLHQLLLHDPRSLPRRVKRALWHFEYASRTDVLDVRWTLVATALESLVHTDRQRSTRQFTRRVSAMAAEAHANLSEADAETAYDLRSSLAHGQGLGSRGSNVQRVTGLYYQMETALRFTILHALRDSNFRHVFEEDDRIRQRWLI